MERIEGSYYRMAVKGDEAELSIYGDISEYDAWDERATSAYTLAQRLEQLGNVRRICVNINSLGGDVKEGIAIYNALQRHPAKVTTRCDGWACSIASVIFMAGDVRVMYPTSLLMIHNAWTWVPGANAAEMRKLADDLDVITGSSKRAYLEHVSVSEAELSRMMDAETWITPDEALEMGFATKVEQLAAPAAGTASQSARASLYGMVLAARAAQSEPEGAKEPEEPEEPGEPEPGEDGDGRDDEADGEQAAQAAFLAALENYLGGTR